MQSVEVSDVVSSQFSPIMASILLAIALLLVRYLALRFWLGRIEGTTADKRKAKASGRGIVAALLVFGMSFIWAPELQAFALSVAAFAVAVVVGTKELILTALGGVYRFITRAYKVGDWISVGTMRGEVIDFGLTSTTLEMLGPGKAGPYYTGYRIVFPNSKLLSEPVINEHENGPYVLYTICAPVKATTNIEKAEDILRAAVSDTCDLTDDRLNKFVETMSQLLDFTPGNLEPRFQLEYSDADKGMLRMSAFMRLDQIPEQEYQILKIYMQWLKSEKLVDSE